MIWNDLGNQYAAAGQLDKAIAALKRARQLDSAFPPPIYNLGVHTLNRCLQQQKAGLASKAETEEMAWEAIGYFNTSLAHDPNNADCHRNLATAYGLVKEPSKASKHAMEALRLTPASERLPNRLLEKAKKLFS
jgi:tetratricopeptide (TPR) repeat protein